MTVPVVQTSVYTFEDTSALINFTEELDGKNARITRVGRNRIEKAVGRIPKRTGWRSDLQRFNGERGVTHIARAAS